MHRASMILAAEGCVDLAMVPISYQKRLGLLSGFLTRSAQQMVWSLDSLIHVVLGSETGKACQAVSPCAPEQVLSSGPGPGPGLGLDQQALSLCPHWLFNRSLTRSLGEHPGCVKFVPHSACLSDTTDSGVLRFVGSYGRDKKQKGINITTASPRRTQVRLLKA